MADYLFIVRRLRLIEQCRRIGAKCLQRLCRRNIVWVANRTLTNRRYTSIKERLISNGDIAVSGIFALRCVETERFEIIFLREIRVVTPFRLVHDVRKREGFARKINRSRVAQRCGASNVRLAR